MLGLLASHLFHFSVCVGPGTRGASILQVHDCPAAGSATKQAGLLETSGVTKLESKFRRSIPPDPHTEQC